MEEGIDTLRVLSDVMWVCINRNTSHIILLLRLLLDPVSSQKTLIMVQKLCLASEGLES